MKKTLLLTITILLFTIVSNAQAFITTWTTLNGTNSISFGATTTGTVNYSWETLPPAAPATGSGTFTGPNVTISGLPTNRSILLTIQPQNFKRFVSVNSLFFYRLENVNQWGSVGWQSMENAFKNNQGLQVSATDFPNLTNVTSLANMFENCTLLNSPFNINFWNLSNVTNISGMFRGCIVFNQALSLWNTSNVTNMSAIFEDATAFNQNVGSWNTSSVTNMSKMFKAARNFDRNIGNWNTANVTNMSEMFSNQSFGDFPMIFNKNISNWNTANVTNMSRMFRGAELFDINIGNWNTSSVTNMSEMFQDALSFNQNIGNWNTANVTNMSGMFSNLDFNGIPENYLFNNGGSSSIENWNTSNVTDMSSMFSRAENFNHNLGNWSLLSNTSLVNMLDSSGLDCNKYSSTLIGWNNNPVTPNNRVLGATFLQYGPEAQAAVTNLVVNKGWGFSGHDMISTIPEFNIDNTYCEGDTIPPLPTVSDNGINGTWSPAINSSQTTTYTFTPNTGECALTTTLTIFINANVTPIFTPVTGICVGENLAALPTTSNNGITGIWSPAINNTQTTTYTFTPNVGQCASTTTLTITVSPLTTPTFTPIDAICSGETVPLLPTTSNNGINGSWSPAINNTETTTYTFTPIGGQCAGTTTLTIVVNTAESPTGDTVQVVGFNATIADIIINPTTVLWYLTVEDAQNSTNPLPSNYILEDGATYYAVNDDGQCRSQPFAITVFFVLSVENNDFLRLKYYPNPVSSTLNISNNTIINQVEIYNLIGQLVLSKSFETSDIELDLNMLPSSIYMVKLKSENQSSVFKIVKE